MKYLGIFVFILISITECYSQSLEWVKTFEDADKIYYKVSTTDQSSNLYLTGVFFGTIDLDPSENVHSLSIPTETNHTDPFIQKLDSTGNFIWAKSFGGLKDERIHSIAVDPEGNVCVTGSFSGVVDFDPGENQVLRTSTYLRDIFILKLNSNGEFLWVHTIVGHGSNSGEQVLTDAENNLYISGVFHGSMNFNPFGSTIISGTDEMHYSTFIMKMTPGGSLVWAKSLSNENDVISTAFGIDSDNNVYCGGNFSQSIDFDPGEDSYVQTSSGNRTDCFILKLDNVGDFVWVRSFGNFKNHDRIFDLSVDQANNIVSTGYTKGGIQAELDSIPAEANTQNLLDDIFIYKMSSDGEFLWSKSFGGADYDYGMQVCSDPSNNIYIMGRAGKETDLDPGTAVFPLSSHGYRGLFVSKYDSEGNMIWTLPELGEEDYHPSSITTDHQGNLIITGDFKLSVDFDPGSGSHEINSNNVGLAFVQKLRQDSCNDLSILFSTLKSIDCSSQGNTSFEGLHGNPPYTYNWNPTLESTDSSAIFITPGIYNLNVTDSIGCTASKMINVTGPSDLSPFNFDANLVTTSSFQTGFQSLIWLDAYNSGCERRSGSLTLVMDDLAIIQDFSVGPDEISGDSLIWNFTELTFDDAHFISNILISVDTLAAIGDTICFDLIIKYFEGSNLTNVTIKNYCFPILNAIDPNDMQVFPTGPCSERYIVKNQKLTYTIRFQNTGNAQAQNVNIIDTISSYLDLKSLKVVGTSHDMELDILNEEIVKFKFPNIQLPDSTTDLTLSQGYVIFEILPKQNIPDGTKIRNNCQIYFDFNPAVNTNSVVNTVVHRIPECDINHLDDKIASIEIYPNPTLNFLNIRSNIYILGLTIFDLSGREIFSKQYETTDITLDLGQITAGIFLLKIHTSAGIQTEKIIIQ